MKTIIDEGQALVTLSCRRIGLADHMPLASAEAYLAQPARPGRNRHAHSFT